jgi:hypothetical protein
MRSAHGGHPQVMRNCLDFAMLRRNNRDDGRNKQALLHKVALLKQFPAPEIEHAERGKST